MKPWCVWTTYLFFVVVVCFGLAEVDSAWINLSTQSCSITEAPILRIPLQILKIASYCDSAQFLFVFSILHPPSFYLSSVFYTEQTNASRFSESYIYSPSCLPQTQKVVFPHNCTGY